ncbi:MAG: sterol desaturase family protein [Polyangiales bacterium]
MNSWLNYAYFYPASLLVISVFVGGLERLFPRRPSQPAIRRALGWDLLHLVFNAHFLGVLVYGIATKWLLPPLDAWVASVGATDILYANVASSWPLALQIVVALFAIDFVQWGIHNALHRVPWLWPFHRCHHSVEDGEMDWVVAFRFQWTEVVVYKLVLFVPLAWMGFGIEAIMFHALFGTLIGHLNHANLNITWGPFRYLLNSPHMHLWHHDYEGDAKSTKNFGIIFSSWDWLFGTAFMPEHVPPRLGFPGAEDYPRSFLAAEVWPLGRLGPARYRRLSASVIALGILGLAWWAHA